MADIAADEDAPINSLHSRSALNSEDNDPSDELQDFRFITNITSGGGKIPKRGEKDFEPHGTRHQEGVLESSRKAMHEALDYTRVHTTKDVRGFFFGDGVCDEEDTEIVMSEGVRGRGLSRNHVVLVETARGTAFKTIGKTAAGTKDARMWLLPEEALYLVERGTMDLVWPAEPLTAARGVFRKDTMAEGDINGEEDEDLPLSLQAAYALLIGEEGEPGKVDLDTFTVYANLKRTGYVVLRAPDHDPAVDQARQDAAPESPSIFTWLFGNYFKEQPIEHLPLGSLIQPGLYRSYNKMYRQLSIIPRHVPTAELTNPTPPEAPYKVVYHVWKPTRIPTFAKSNPGAPDFRIAIVSSRNNAVPTLTQLTSLLESTPWAPPPNGGPEKMYQRLKNGYRNVILAVVDQGIISYLKVGEGAFGEEKLFERFDRAPPRGGKRGGFGKNRGGGGGRGRGRGK